MQAVEAAQVIGGCYLQQAAEPGGARWQWCQRSKQHWVVNAIDAAFDDRAIRLAEGPASREALATSRDRAGAGGSVDACRKTTR